MPITHTSGGTIITGASIPFARLCALKGMLALELKGMHRSKGRTAYSILKQITGLRGDRARVYEAVCKMVDAQRAQQEHIDETGRANRL
jgi:hypothetical protein